MNLFYQLKKYPTIRSVFNLLFAYIILSSCKNETAADKAIQWNTYEIVFKAAGSYTNAYTAVDVWVDFVNDKNDTIVRPAFWDGGNIWKVRFAPPDYGHLWKWRSYASVNDNGLAGKEGSIMSVTYDGENRLLKHGMLQMSPGKRNVIHADGTPFLLVGDTPWSIPYRATTEQVTVYADDRKQKGFNTALLITLQPDRNAEGPEARNTVLGFMRAFEDITSGQINKLNPSYFNTLDSIINILIQHEITPVYAPFAHGYGWKGKGSVGALIEPDQYSRYCRYLVARYGSTPALWLISLDDNGKAQGVKPGGETIEQWDAYKQPTGLHYNPHDETLAGWANGDSTCCFHQNRVYQEEEWLDFQWAQTGHDGLHIYRKVEKMYDAQPTKANMNGEPTYEAMGGGKFGLGWWQGEDAWNQLMLGGTMGVVYGAACLWQWKITQDEEGWEEWTDAPYSWKDALSFEGSKYVGAIAKAFRGFDFTDMQKRRDLASNNQPLLAKENVFYVSFLEKGQSISIKNVPAYLPYYWFDPMAGEFKSEGKTKRNDSFTPPDSNPWVIIIGERKKE